MAILPLPSIEDQIKNLIEIEVPEEARAYLGLSSIGSPCKRKLWYQFRWVEKKSIPARIKRLFDRGNYEEEVVLRDLKKIKFEVTESQSEIELFNGLVQGHIDFIIKHERLLPNPTILEVKTANNKSFNNFKKKKLAAASRQYFYQAQAYMGYKNIHQCLFFITNKDNEERYLELVDFDEEVFKEIKYIIEAILTTDDPPPRIGDSTYFECKICEFKHICHKDHAPQKNCRTCKYGTIEDQSFTGWTCNSEFDLTIEAQRVGCNNHVLLDSLQENR